tara:strand:- start:135 stop:524 length:390 start_codon:yes stop_codon:yes gene_type:complete
MTIQAGELLFYEGEKHYLINVPSIPDSIIQLIPRDYYEKSTACYRGYVATWEIKDDKLYLTDLSSSNYEFIHSPPFLADWFNGQIKFGTGNKKLSSSWVSVYDYKFEIHLTIENGLVIEDNIFENTSFR